MRKIYIFFALISSASLLIQAEIKLTQNNGYEGIMIVVEKQLEQHKDFIPALKELLQNASTFMYEATGGLAYFGTISVVIPPHWKLTEIDDNVISVDNPIPLSAAHIRIDTPNPKYMDNPYTSQPEPCGKPGKYIHLTKDFILNQNGKMFEDFGDDLGRQLVHEWAHFRYGVYDEYGEMDNELYPHLYLDSGHIRPVACGQDVPGILVNGHGKHCYYQELFRTCTFKPIESKVNITSSIMYLPYIPSINQFCENSGVKAHNIKAPSKQNIKCRYRSTWDVIGKHKDMSQAHRQGFKPTHLQIIQPRKDAEPRFVVAIDVASSMNTPLRPKSSLEYVQLATTNFLSFVAPESSKVALVEFAQQAKITSNLTKINSISRPKLIKMLPKKAYASVDLHCLGCGLKEAIKALSLNEQSAAGGTILFITDGGETQLPGISDVMGEVLKAKVVVNTIAIGGQASPNLYMVSKATGGKTFYFSGRHEDLIKLNQAFFASVVQAQYAETADSVVLMKTIPFKVSPMRLWYTVKIEPSLGAGTTFIVTGRNNLDHLQVSLNSAYNQEYTEFNSSIYYKYNNETFTKVFKLPFTPPGYWALILNNTHGVQQPFVNLIVTSKQRSRESLPVRANCWLSSTYVNLYTTDHVAIYCRVHKGHYPVIDAKVNATIWNTFDNIYDNVFLYDDGSGADSEKRDGVYSAYFIGFRYNNRYTVLVRALNYGSARVLKEPQVIRRFTSSKDRKPESQKPATKFPIESFRNTPKDYVWKAQKIATMEKLEPFTRFVTVDSFYATNVAYFLNTRIVPSRVSDLKAIKVDSLNSSVVVVLLKWTSVGANYDLGKASYLDIRYSTNYSQILQNFGSMSKVAKKDVTSGSLKPEGPHTAQSIALELYRAFNGSSLYFALKTTDGFLAQAPLSNIAEAMIISPPASGHKPPDNSSDSTGEKFMLGIGITALILFLGACYACLTKTDNKIRKWLRSP